MNTGEYEAVIAVPCQSCSPLERHPSLIKLELSGGGGEYDFTSIGQCSALTKLSIWNCDTANITAISQLDKLTSLKLSENDRDPIEILKTSMSSESLEELAINPRSVNRAELFAALGRFTNLVSFSVMFRFYYEIDDGLLSEFHRLKQLRVLSIRFMRHTITSNGLVALVRRLVHLEQLSICAFSFKHLQLEKSTYLRICEICSARNQKLVIHNYDPEIDNYGTLDEPFAEDSKQKSVQFLSRRSSDPSHKVFTI